MKEPFFYIQSTPITWIRLTVCVFLLIFAFFFAVYLKKSIARSKKLQKRFGRTLIEGSAQILYGMTLVLGVYISLTIIGIDLTGVAVLAGACSVGIGFGFQAIFTNFAAGLILLFEKKIQIGDVIELSDGKTGVVEEIHLRYTLLCTDEKRGIIVPNSEMIVKTVINQDLFSALERKSR